MNVSTVAGALGDPVASPSAWPEQEADMTLIRRVNDLLAEAMHGATPAIRDAAQAEERALMPGYGEATSRFRAATRRAAAH
ncbi:hypothetical protein AAFN86_08865 [Roseomonas sp. CAU 1739]|uniref:hypothetical protein n=1 Tax=Roseomonas sp. CAU 1739 TaxID=3140364 RepID=UPI00325AC356